MTVMTYNLETLLTILPYVCGIIVTLVFVLYECRTSSVHSSSVMPAHLPQGYLYHPNADTTFILLKKGRYFRAYLSSGTTNLPMLKDRHGSYLNTQCTDAQSAELFLDRSLADSDSQGE